jgi:D-arginine dehydrogenase
VILTDVLVVGGGIAGLSLAAALAPRCRVALVEKEPRLFSHTSGRSAQQSQPTYGPAPIRRFTAATLRLLDALPGELVTPRPLVWVDRADTPPRIATLLADMDDLRPLSIDDAVELFPALRPDAISGAALDSASVEVDVPALRDHLRASAETAGAHLALGHPVAAARRDGADWVVETAVETFRAATVVIAAGPWADEAARLFGTAGFGLTPTRRTVVVAAVHGEPVDPRAPMVMDAAHTFYLRASGDDILASSLEDEPSVAEDAQPIPEVVERTVELVNRLTRLGLGAPLRAWTGLRTLSRDGLPVVGWDSIHDGLYWLVGQGGYGIQTSLGLAAAVAEVLSGRQVAAQTAEDLAAFRPGRFA